MRCSKVFMYLLLRLQQICCCCFGRRRQTRTYNETLESRPNDEFDKSSGESTIDLENTDGLGTLPPVEKINLDYDEDDAYARSVRNAAAAAAKTAVTASAVVPQPQTLAPVKKRPPEYAKAVIELQATRREDWLSQDLFSGERTVTVIGTALGPLRIAYPPLVNGSNGSARYTVSETGENTGVIAAWEDQSQWASVAIPFAERLRIVSVKRV